MTINWSYHIRGDSRINAGAFLFTFDDLCIKKGACRMAAPYCLILWSRPVIYLSLSSSCMQTLADAASSR